MAATRGAGAGLVTPEAVVLEFETAGLGSRTLAILVDLVLQFVVLTLLAVVTGVFVAGGIGGSTAAVVVLVLASALVLLGYPIAWETLWRGRTPGKAWLGLRVVTRDGAPIRFRHAAVRGFLTLVDFYLTGGVAAVLCALATRDDQRLGDLAAGTVVLRERTGARAPVAVAFAPPPGFEAFTAGLDTAGLRPDDYGAARSFLLRAPTLPPHQREALARQLATAVAGRLAHRPPAGIGAEAYLACVVAAAQARTGGPVAAAVPAPPPASSLGASVWAPRPGRPTPTVAPPSPTTPDPAARGAAPAPADGGFAPPS